MFNRSNLFIKIYEKVGIKSLRTRNIAKHVGLSFFYKFGSILASFLLVPITINYLEAENYGVWLTLSSFISWFAFFDIGLGNGLRNKLAESIAKNDMRHAQGYVSAAYYTIGSVSLLLIVVFLAVNNFIDWTIVFNSGRALNSELAILMPVVFSFFCLQLISKLIVTIYTSDQKPSVQGKIGFITSSLSLMFIWFLTKSAEGSLLIFGIIYSALPVIILLILNFLAFRSTYHNIKPMFQFWNLEYTKDIFGVGIKFFILQMAALVVFSTDNFIISKIFGPEQVVPYNISYKYFSILIMIASIIIIPYWSSFTDAYTRQDFKWIKISVKSIIKLWLLVPILLIIMILAADKIFYLWVGEKVRVPLLLNVSMALFVLIMTFNMVFVNFINGVGKIKIQVFISIVSMIINIPLSIVLSKYLGWGVKGVILATCFTLMLSSIVFPIQYYKIVNRKAFGIWDK